MLRRIRWRKREWWRSSLGAAFSGQYHLATLIDIKSAKFKCTVCKYAEYCGHEKNREVMGVVGGSLVSKKVARKGWLLAV